MKNYIDLVRDLQGQYVNLEVQKVSREDNTETDAIARWASSDAPMPK